MLEKARIKILNKLIHKQNAYSIKKHFRNMNLKFFLFLTSVFLMFTSGINAQEFTKAYGNTNSNIINSGRYSASHNAYFVLGTENDKTITITKIDLNGNVIWSKKYSGNYNSFELAEIKVPNRSTTDIILTLSDYGTYYDLYVMRVNGDNGSVVWNKKVKYPTENRFSNFVITNDNNIVAATTIRGGGLFLTKLNLLGEVLWAKTIDRSGDFQKTSNFVPDNKNGFLFGFLDGINGIIGISFDGIINFAYKNNNNSHFRIITKHPTNGYIISSYLDWNNRATNNELIYINNDYNIIWKKLINPTVNQSGYCVGCTSPYTAVNKQGEIISITESAISGAIKFNFSKFNQNGEHIYSVSGNNNDLQFLSSGYGANNTIFSLGNTTRENLCLPTNKNGLFSTYKDNLEICDTKSFTPKVSNSTTTLTELLASSFNLQNTNYTLSSINTIVTDNILKARNLCSGQEEKVNLGPDISTCTSGNITLNAGTGYKSYQWSNGAATPTIQVNTSGNYWVKATDDCDRISRDTIKITISSPSTKNQSIAICSGKTYIVGQNTYRVAGNYKDTLISKNGCDSIINTTLTIKPNSTKVQSFAICQGDSLKVGNSIYKTAGTYTNTLTSSNSCDSIITTTITIKPISTKTQTFAICQGDSVKVGNSIYKTAGTFKDILTAKNGCDSTITTTITIKPISTKTQTFAICQGDSIKVGNSIYKTAGTFRDILTARNGCDSIITTILTINSKITQSISFSICLGDSIKVGNSIYKTAGTYKDTLTTPRGCDSIITTSLTIKPITTKSLNYSICQGDSVKVGNSIYKTAGTFKDILTAKNGCDSIITSVITIKPISTKTQTFTICQGDSVNVGNSIYKTAGTFIDILTAQNACDSIITSVIIITPTESQTVNYSLCKGDSIKLFGKSYSQEGIFNDTLTNIKGCDSIYLIIEITFSPTLKLDLGKDTILCDGEFLALGSNIQAEKYNWSNGSTQPTIEAEAPGTYSLTISNDCGSISDTIVLNAIDCDCSVFIPNAFSPNGDGKNDVLIIKEENIISSNFMIYNKWGMEVFTSKNNDQNWNGVNKDKQLPPDVYGYYYEGTCIKGNKMEYKGNITIVR
jgi:gliding motility-associated-like protein